MRSRLMKMINQNPRKLTVREEASKIIGVRIPDGDWDNAILYLDAAGKVTKKTQLSLIIMLCRRLEEFEKFV